LISETCSGDEETACLTCDTPTTHRILETFNNTCLCDVNYIHALN